MSEEVDRHVLRRFEICQKLGKGVSETHHHPTLFIASSKRPGNGLLIQRATRLLQAYGVVWKAIEKRTRQVLALKKCFDAFRNATDAQRTFREIMYLQALAGHDNLIRLQHVVKAENGRDIYLTFDHMGETTMMIVHPAVLQPDIFYRSSSSLVVSSRTSRLTSCFFRQHTDDGLLPFSIPFVE